MVNWALRAVGTPCAYRGNQCVPTKTLCNTATQNALIRFTTYVHKSFNDEFNPYVRLFDFAYI